MHKHIPEYNKENIHIARLLRRKMTDAERKLWSLLRNNQLGVKFRRQVPFGEHVLDFYCPAAKLCVELDGSQHYSQDGLNSDAERDDDLRDHGIEVVRYSNAEFLRNPDGVMKAISEKVQDRIKKNIL
jgi:very-short-patch-repair endonuclease